MFNTQPMDYVGQEGDLACYKERPRRRTGKHLPHMTTDDLADANPIRVFWPAKDGDTYDDETGYPDIETAARGLLALGWHDCTMGTDINARDVVYHLSNAG